jgi:anti-sigma regulatory factor (Ser/Thr protein kinase)
VRVLIRTLIGYTAVIDDALLVATEVATNAVLHTRSGLPGGTFTVRAEVRATGDVCTLRVEVHDAGPFDADQPADPRPPDQRWRGLMLVDAIANRWGMEPVDPGHVVWLELDWCENS